VGAAKPEPPAAARIKGALAATGRALAAAGRAVGRGARHVYGQVDPDVARHLAQIPLLSYSLLSKRQQPVVAAEDDGHPPLVFVHGLGGTRGDFMLMSARLWLAGRKRSYRIGFAKGRSMDEMAAALARFIAEVREVNAAPRVDLVAHSLGGVVMRLALHDHRLARSLGTVVTLGSPHHGTQTARFSGAALIKDLRPESALMQRLSRLKWPPSVRAVTFWSRNDLMIVPAESAALEGIEQVDASGFTHYSYLVDPRAWDAVRRVLAGERVDTVG
jgi:triacylglycerol esterase/lipase EstA (alpha/beta hydrolase family)